MSSLISFMWFFIGIVWIIAGKPFMEVAACFLICGIFCGANEIYLLRKEMEDWEIDE